MVELRHSHPAPGEIGPQATDLLKIERSKNLFATEDAFLLREHFRKGVGLHPQELRRLSRNVRVKYRIPLSHSPIPSNTCTRKHPQPQNQHNQGREKNARADPRHTRARTSGLATWAPPAVENLRLDRCRMRARQPTTSCTCVVENFITAKASCR
jgi:hypothetical protein